MTTITKTVHARATAGVPLLQAEGVIMRFGGLTAVNDVNLTVNEGEIVGLIGPNGAGKTPFFNCLTSLYKPTYAHLRPTGVQLPPTPRPAGSPRVEPRAGPGKTEGHASLKSVMVGHRPVTSFVNTSRSSSGCPRLAMISPKPNTPIAMPTKPNPSVSSGMSKL